MASLATKNVGGLWGRRPVHVSNSKFNIILSSCAFLFVLTFDSCTAGIDVVYMTPLCNSSVPASVGGLIEPDPGLYYRENVDCFLTLVGLPTHRLLLQFARFALESDSEGNCYDSLSVYDGSTVGGSPLTPQLCGRLHQLPDIESGRSNVTFRLRTDGSGRMMGFGIYYTQFTDAPCSSDQFACNNSRCIDPSLVCDTLDMCGDWSDEGNCTAPQAESQGLSVAAFVSIIVSALIIGYALIAVISKLFHVFQERQLMKQMLAQVEREIRTNPYSDTTSISPVDRDDVNVDVANSSSGSTLFSRKRLSKVVPA